MSFLDQAADEVLPSPRSQQRRRRVVMDLLGKFQAAFPQVTYELLWESPTVNAQAWRFGSSQFVRVYGGLVRHRAVTKYGLALTLAHETGHHLGGIPRDPAMPWMSWQGQADYWAASKGLPKIWGAYSTAATLRGAREFLRLHRMLAAQSDEYETELSPDCRYCILRSGALGQQIPRCALDAFAASNELIGQFERQG
jgi:hypothetical protein